MKNTSGTDLIALAGTTAAALAQCIDDEEIIIFCELLGLLKHNLEVIKCRRIALKNCEKQKKEHVTK